MHSKPQVFKYSRRDWLRRTSCALAVGAAAHAIRANEGQDGAHLRVMSFNIRYGSANDGENRWERRRELVASTINSFKPDLLGLQEVLEFQGNYLKEKLPEFDFHGVGRDDGKREGEFAPVLFRRERFTLLDAGHFWLSPTPTVVGSRGWDAALPRMASWVRLRDRERGTGELLFLNTHFDHQGAKARLESARLCRQYLEQLVHPGQFVVVTGDFNTTEDGEPYQLFLTSTGGSELQLIDSYRAVHPERKPDEASFNGWQGTLSGSRIDWILYSANLEAARSEINRTRDGNRLPSDHYPVEAVLRYR